MGRSKRIIIEEVWRDNNGNVLSANERATCRIGTIWHDYQGFIGLFDEPLDYQIQAIGSDSKGREILILTSKDTYGRTLYRATVKDMICYLKKAMDGKSDWMFAPLLGLLEGYTLPQFSLSFAGNSRNIEVVLYEE